MLTCTNIVLRWSNEQIIATPRTISPGTYVPLKELIEKLLALVQVLVELSQKIINTDEQYTNKIFAQLSVPFQCRIL